ncbi:hypothetical protein [Teredinibacter purpureus]|uniref:hypothetical protein n=1 Tax=Teredinibacter purpureus TaxID=2731756 RepID=UPI0005F87FEE|nr:hypothetical protein [Teredinibacter purpureus]
MHAIIGAYTPDFQREANAVYADRCEECAMARIGAPLLWAFHEQTASISDPAVSKENWSNINCRASAGKIGRYSIGPAVPTRYSTG